MEINGKKNLIIMKKNILCRKNFDGLLPILWTGDAGAQAGAGRSAGCAGKGAGRPGAGALGWALGAGLGGTGVGERGAGARGRAGVARRASGRHGRWGAGRHGRWARGLGAWAGLGLCTRCTRPIFDPF